MVKEKSKPCRNVNLLFIEGIFLLLLFLNILFYFQNNPVSCFITSSLKQFLPLFTALLLYCSAYFLGDLFISKFKLTSHKLINFFIIELAGLQILIYFLLLLGFCHILIPEIFWPFVILTSLSAGKKLFHGLKSIKERLTFQFNFSEMPFLFLLIFLIGILTANAYSPFSWYDALVYHMAVPQHYLEAGKIFLIPGNVYSNFPLNAEILFLGSLLLGSELGAKFLILGQVLMILILCAVFLKDLTKNKIIPLIAMILIGSNIQVFIQLIQGNIDIFLACALTVYLLHIFYSPFDHRSDFILNGILGGIVLGFKYQAGPFFIIPGFIFLCLKVLSVKKNYLNLFLVPLISLLVFSPWMLKNAALTGNPFFPFFYDLFSSKSGVSIHYAQFLKLHQNDSFHLYPLAYSFFSSLDGLLTLLVIFNIMNRQSLMAGILLPLLFWGTLSRGEIRYILPVYPLLISSSLSNISSLMSTKGVSLLKPFFLIFLVIRIYSLILLNPDIMEYAAGIKNVSEKTASFADPYYRVIPYLNSHLPKDSYVLMIGEARSYGCRFKTFTSTLFDKNIIEDAIYESKDTQEVISRLIKQGFTHILLNKSELSRLQKTYGQTFPSTAGFSFPKNSRSSQIFTDLLTLIRQNNQLPSKIPPLIFLYKL